MFMGKKFEDIKGEETTTVIGAGVEVEGTFTASGNITIKGHLTGSVETKNDLYVAETASIDGEVKTKNAFISGRIKGNVIAEEKLKFSSTAKIDGDLICQNLSVEEGAILNGKCQMSKKEEVSLE